MRTTSSSTHLCRIESTVQHCSKEKQTFSTMFSQSIAVPLKERVIKSSNSCLDVACGEGPGRTEHYKLWTEAQMSSVCELVQRGETSTSHTAVSFNIPSSTLNDRVSGKTVIGAVGGPPKYLSYVE